MRIAAGVSALVVLVLAAVASGAGTQGTIVFSADQAPTLAGEIWRISPDGKATDLSRSPAPDSDPAVSPNGKLVAFSSARNGRRAEYVIGVDGKGLRRISPFLGSGDPNVGPTLDAAWAPGGASLAVVALTPSGSPGIYLASPHGGRWRLLVKPADNGRALLGWSKRGQLAYTSPDSGSVRVVDARGKVLLDTAGEDAWWSPSGRLAVKRSTDTIQIFDASLRRIATVAGDNATWSRAGVLATMSTKGVLALRPGGTGKPTLTRRVGNGEPMIQWVGTRRLRYFGPDGWILMDARTGHTFIAAGAYGVFNSIVSPDGTFALGEQWRSGGTRALVRTRLGGSTTTLATTDACGYEGDAWENLQLLPDGSAIYDTAYCLVSSDIWSVSGAGGTPKQLTHTPADETEPALSPDGTHIAFSAKATANKCDGCDETLWVMKVDGSGAHSFPNSADPDINYDDSPTFSPDGKTILFARSGPNDAGLYTVPAAGGAATPLGVKGLAPVWGPAKIAYQNLVDGLAVADPDGRNATALHVDGTPAFSASGRLAVLRTSPTGALSIYFPAAKRALPLPGLRGTYRGVGLAWSPDETHFAFDASDASGIGDVWTIGVDGTGLTRITHDLGAAGRLSWR